jgi:antitoxin (DNA-binding transcriptional repressor) of toxin-antitoxin stability system
MTENALPLPYEVQEMTTTEARKHLPDLVNMAAFGHVTTVLVRDGRRLARIVPAGHERLHAHVVARGHPGQIRDGHFVNLV